MTRPHTTTNDERWLGKYATSAFIFFRNFCVALFLSLAVPLQCSGKQHSAAILTHCGKDVLLPLVNQTEEKLVHINFPLSWDSANCSWVIPRPDSGQARAGNTLGFHFSTSLQQDGHLEVNDQGSGANGWVISQFCSLDNDCVFDGRPGFATVVSLTLHRLTQKNVTVFSYASVLWTGRDCPETLMKVVAIPGQQEVIHVGHADHLPQGLSCFWQFLSPDGGLLVLELSGFIADNPQCSVDNYLLLKDGPGDYHLQKIIVCDNGIGIRHTSYTGSVFLEFHSNDTRSRPPTFSIAYSAQVLCNPRRLYLEARYQETAVLKGASDSSINSSCSWELVAREHKVVMLTGLDNQEFLHDCSPADYLSVGENKRVSLCNNSSFPVWSQGRFLDIHLHHRPSLTRRQFFLYFEEVEKVIDCQGHPRVFQVSSSDWNNVSFNLLPSSLPSIGHQCCWIFRPKSEGQAAVQVRVSALATEGTMEKTNCIRWSGLFVAYEAANLATSDIKVVLPSCFLHESAVRLTFTGSLHKLMIVEFLVDSARAFSIDYRKYMTSSAGNRLVKPALFIAFQIGLVLAAVRR